MNDYSQIYDYNLITLRLITQLWFTSFWLEEPLEIPLISPGFISRLPSIWTIRASFFQRKWKVQRPGSSASTYRPLKARKKLTIRLRWQEGQPWGKLKDAREPVTLGKLFLYFLFFKLSLFNFFFKEGIDERW